MIASIFKEQQADISIRKYSREQMGRYIRMKREEYTMIEQEWKRYLRADKNDSEFKYVTSDAQRNYTGGWY